MISSSSVRPIITLQDLSINVKVEKSSDINLDFDMLKQNHIIPIDWQLSHSPVSVNNLIQQLTLTNGIRISNQYDSVTFAEPMMEKNPNYLRIADISKKYIEIFPDLDYCGINLEFKTFIRFDDNDIINKQLIHRYFISLFCSDLSDGSVLESASANVDLVYNLQGFILNINIKEVEISLPNRQSLRNILFSGRISHRVEKSDDLNKLQAIPSLIDLWKSDLEAYISLLNKLLRQ